jgi:tRNA(Ile)-lysidine synthase
VSANVELSMRLVQALRQVPSASHYVIALSGGLDSIALLHGFRLVHPTLPLSAIHVNHGLSPNADEWAAHCQGVCQALAIPCHIERVTVVAEGEGIEAAARKARYEVFEQCLSSGEMLLQGHHQNDQAETVLMRALRGAGPKGLSAIPQERLLKNSARVYRPWLNISRLELSHEAKRLGFSWVEDESNEDLGFDRNFIRHEILGKLEQRWPKAINSLASVAERAKETQGFVDAWCEQNFARLEVKTCWGASISLAGLLGFTLAEQRMLLRYWFDSLAVSQPPERIFDRIWSELINARQDALPILEWQGGVLRRYSGALFYQASIVLEDFVFSERIEFKSLGQKSVVVLPFGEVTLSLCAARPEHKEENSRRLFVSVPSEVFALTVSSRQGGESLVVDRGGVPKSLKKLYQQYDVPTWERQRLPLFSVDEVLVASAMGCVAHAYQRKESGLVLVVDLSKLS